MADRLRMPLSEAPYLYLEIPLHFYLSDEDRKMIDGLQEAKEIEAPFLDFTRRTVTLFKYGQGVEDAKLFFDMTAKLQEEAAAKGSTMYFYGTVAEYAVRVQKQGNVRED